MPHIHTGPGEHDHTVSAYIIRTDFAEPMMMLHMHKKLGRWMQFGGHIEKDENPRQTLAHEILEETGYDMDQLDILQPHDRIKELPFSVLHPVAISDLTHRFDDVTMEDHYHTDRGYALVTNQKPRHKVGKTESQQIELFTLEQLRALTNTFPDVPVIARFAMERCLPNWERVPAIDFRETFDKSLPSVT